MLRIPLVALPMLLLPLPTGGAASAAIDHLRWMAGCWEQRNGARVAHEQWMAPLGGTMLGMSRTVVGDATREYEQLRIEQRPAGDLAYVASPSGQATATFVASAASDSLVRFENPAHDFPQRIQYRRAGADSLIARIEGTRNGQVRGIDFPMRRVPCAGERVAGSGG